MKKITILLEVDAPDHLSNADIEQAIARMLDIGQADARETEEADEEAQAALVAVSLAIGAPTTLEMPLSVVVGVEGGIVQGATAAIPCDVIVADYDLVDGAGDDELIVNLALTPDEPASRFVPIVHAALVSAATVGLVRAALLEQTSDHVATGVTTPC